MPVLLTDLSAGQTFDTITFQVTADQVRAYRNAVGDTLSLYDDDGVLPPLAVAALALGALLERVKLPDGSLHASESLETRAAVRPDSTVECRARLAQRSQRAGWVVSVLETELRSEGRTAIIARATVLSPEAGS